MYSRTSEVTFTCVYHMHPDKHGFMQNKLNLVIPRYFDSFSNVRFMKLSIPQRRFHKHFGAQFDKKALPGFNLKTSGEKWNIKKSDNPYIEIPTCFKYDVWKVTLASTGNEHMEKSEVCRGIFSYFCSHT